MVVCAGCNNGGTFAPAGSVTASDACYHTVCVVDSSGKGTLQTSFKGNLLFSLFFVSVFFFFDDVNRKLVNAAIS